MPARGVFAHATIVTAFNPHSVAFFIVFVPQFTRTETALWPQFSILIATFVAFAGANALTYALLAERLRRRANLGCVSAWLSRLGGCALIGMGVATAVTQGIG